MANKNVNSPVLKQTTDLFITLTGKPHLYNKTPNLQHAYLLPSLVLNLKEMKFEGTCYAELTEMCNVHYHLYGKFSIPEKVKYGQDYIKLKFKKPADQGFGRIDSQLPDDPDKIKKYIAKDRDRSLELIGHHSIWKGSNQVSVIEDRLGVIPEDEEEPGDMFFDLNFKIHNKKVYIK